jgi:hypothetical protein
MAVHFFSFARQPFPICAPSRRQPQALHHTLEMAGLKFVPAIPENDAPKRTPRAAEWNEEP